MRDYLMIVSVLITGCATTAEMTPIEYRFLDVLTEKRIELVYQNTSRHAMCLSPAEWPNLGGKIDQASNRVFLIVGGERFPIENFNTGYCPNCAIRVSPGEKISASIPYADFNLPERLFDEQKKLDFVPEAFRCRAE